MCSLFLTQVSNAGLGKLSQNDVWLNTAYITSWYEFSRFRDDPRKNVKHFVPLEKDLAEVTFEPREDMLGFHRNVQVKFISRQSVFDRVTYFFC